jgi:indole-3-glycerol phosphate synthase/phosphoribosylanthranilate isomerase
VTNVLAEILAAKRKRLADGLPTPRVKPSRASDGARFLRALGVGGPRVIAEIKHRSPSAGVLLTSASRRIAPVARAYARGGAAALSVVVEQDFFDGEPEWIGEAKDASDLPVLMKDFVVDERQLDFALALGADAVLLIVSALEDAELASLHAAAKRRALAVLVEAHDEDEVRRALAVGAEIVGINARNLSTFRVDLALVARLGELLPEEVVCVAESGIKSKADVDALPRFGAFLVGEALLVAPDPTRALRRLRGAGSTEVKVCGVTRAEDLGPCRAAGVDWIGLNLSPLSPRRLSVERAVELAERARFAKGVVAVFAGNEPEEVRAAVEALKPDVVQLAGGMAAPGGDARVWRTVRVGGGAPEALDGVADALLYDTAVPGAAGGTGRAFDWSLLDGVPRTRPLVLAGGLTPANVAEAVRRVRPEVVDVASGVERAPGVKDAAKVTKFVTEVRSVVDP